jgi:hypothetical protein
VICTEADDRHVLDAYLGGALQVLVKVSSRIMGSISRGGTRFAHDLLIGYVAQHNKFRASLVSVTVNLSLAMQIRPIWDALSLPLLVELDRNYWLTRTRHHSSV